MPNRHRPTCRYLAAAVPVDRGATVPEGCVFVRAPRRFAPGDVGVTPAARSARWLTSDLGTVRAAAVPKLGGEVPRRHPDAARDGHGRDAGARPRTAPKPRSNVPERVTRP